jgi:protocatechuate 3,4-dioxygenase beta subunit
VKLVIQESSIAGVVVDVSGDPVPEARVKAMPTGRWSMANVADDVTDSHGHFDFGGLEPGEYLVSATLSDQHQRLGEGEHVSSGNRNVKLVIQTPATLTGRVLLDGAPMPYFGTMLTENPERPLGIPNGVASADGRFKVRGIQPGKWGLVLVGPGTARKTIKDIDIEEGKTVDLGDLVMSHGLRINGHVQDSTGAAVPGAIVTIGGNMPDFGFEPLQRLFRGFFQTTTDDAGGFVFDGVAPLGGSLISATHPDRGSSLPSITPDNDATIDLVLVASGGIDGVVEGFKGVSGAVIARRTDDVRNTHFALVDSTGHFHFDGLPSGDYTLEMMPMPGEMMPTPVIVSVVANLRANAKLAMPKATVMLSVTVSGRACSLVMLAAPGEGAPKLSVVSTMALCTNSTAVFDHVQPGSYRACTDETHCVPVTVATAPDQQAIEIRVP